MKTAATTAYYNGSDSLRVTVTSPGTYDSLSFGYPGKAYDNSFVSVDTSITNILGWNTRGEINYVKISYESGGSISIHLAPMAFTNFFLLHRIGEGGKGHQNKTV